MAGPSPVMASCGICSALVIAATAPVLAVSDGPTIAFTFWLNTRSSALLLAMSALEPSSSMRILSGRPLMPPLSLMSFSASCTPLRSACPRPAPGPVRESTEPILIGSPDGVCATPGGAAISDNNARTAGSPPDPGADHLMLAPPPCSRCEARPGIAVLGWRLFADATYIQAMLHARHLPARRLHPRRL